MTFTIVVKTISRILYPFMLLYGLYIVMHGHLTPGGGFPGGVVIATSIVLYTFYSGISEKNKKVKIYDVVKSLILIVLLLIISIGVLIATNLPKNIVFNGKAGNLLSSGPILMLNIASGLEVAFALAIVIYAMLLIGGRR